jgi:hypothetical protein
VNVLSGPEISWSSSPENFHFKNASLVACGSNNMRVCHCDQTLIAGMVADVIRLRRLFDAEQIEKLTLVSRRALAAAISSQGVIGQTETSVILISLGPPGTG